MRQFYCLAQYLLFVAVTSVLILSCAKNDEPIPLDGQHQMITFKIDTILGQIDETNHTVTITVPGTMDLTKVKPVIAVSDKASVTPASGTEVNLTKPVTYTITAEDKSQQQYVVTAKKAVNLGNRILSFQIKLGTTTYNGVINDTSFTIKTGVPFTKNGVVDLSRVNTTVIIPAGASVTPAVNAVVDFTSPVTYKVTAPDGEVQEYTVSVLNNETDLTFFEIPLSGFTQGSLRQPLITQTGQENGLWPEEITGLAAPFAVFHVLESEDVSHLTLKSVKLSQGATISPATDVPQDFNSDVVYTVTSQYGNTQQYTLRAVKKKIIMRNEFYPTSYMINATGGNLEEYMSDQDIQEAWLLDGKAEYKVTVDPATRYAWGYVTSRFYANTATLPQGYYWLKVKLANGAVISETHRFYMY
jgi:hypothetical protein